ncbi:hypothetical protein Bbelb_319680 [Branchiostoma belcheri]|nr:hypothetical protein Bbelb_319680 [Branchiostoma belcheri]
MPTRPAKDTSPAVHNKTHNSQQSLHWKTLCQSLELTPPAELIHTAVHIWNSLSYNVVGLITDNNLHADGATTTYGKERILAKPRFVKQTQPIEDGPPNIKMEGNDRQQANKDNITRPTNLENTTATSSANVVRTVEPQTSMFASAERLSK